MFAASSAHRPESITAPARRPRLLIISDAVEGFRNIQSGIKREDFEVKHASSLLELRHACTERHDLVIIDVNPSKLTAILKLIRSSAGYAEIPVLVERTNINNDSSLAGVLPQYRAMPCSGSELFTLLQYHKQRTQRIPERRGML